MVFLKYWKIWLCFDGWKKLLGDAKEKINDYQEKKRIETEEQDRIDALENEKTLEYTNKVNELLDKFEISKFEEFMKRYLNVEPQVMEIHDKKTDTTYERPMTRREYLEDINEYLRSKEITFEHLKDYALKAKIVAPSFFGIDSKDVDNERNFESIIKSIKDDFQPEKITDEKELQSQLIIFIKAKFPELNAETEFVTKSGNELDIVIDDDYVLELKVPKSRTVLRNLGAQLEEYAEEYPNLCAVIADISGYKLPDGKILNITEDINDYADKYLRKFKVPSIILNVRMRA